MSKVIPEGASESVELIRFGNFLFDCEDRRLSRNGEPIDLSPRAFDVLAFLLDHSGKLSQKEEILATVWSDVTVSDSVLKVAIAEIRRALGDSARNPRFIETVHRSGYRWISQRSLPAPMAVFGRTEPLGRLDSALRQAQSGQRSALFVSGEPGIGKTALIDTFVDSCAQEDLRIARGQCRESYGEGEAFLPLLEALAALARGPRGDQILATLKQHAPTWLVQMPWFLAEADRDELAPLVRSASRQRMLREIVEAIEVMCADRPMVLVFEDLHWSDPSTLDVLSSLIQRREPVRLAVIGSCRLGEAQRAEHPVHTLVDRVVAEDRAKKLELDPLTKAEVEQYLAYRLSAGVADSVIDLAYRHSEGNPLFLVSYVASLISLEYLVKTDAGWSLTQTIQAMEEILPEQLKGLLERRFEDLSETQSEVLEIASVIGPDFSAEEVAHVGSLDLALVEVALDSVMRADPLIRTLGSVNAPAGGEAGRFQFTHVLQQRAMMSRLSAPRRMRLHARFADYLSGTSDQPARLGYHYYSAGSFDRAIEHWDAAGTRAFEQFAHHEALGLFDRALETLERLPAGLDRDRVEMGLLVKVVNPLRAIFGPGIERISESYVRAVEISETLPSGPELYPLWAGTFAYYIAAARLDEAKEVSDRLMEVAESMGVDIVLQSALLTRGIVSLYQGRLELAVDSMDRSLALAPDHSLYNWGYETQSLAYLFSSLAVQLLGRPDEARDRADKGRACAERGTDAYTLTLTLQFESFVLRWQSDLDRTEKRVLEVQEICREETIHLWEPVTGWTLAWLCAQREGPAAGLASMLEHLDHYEQIGTEAARTDYLAATAEICAGAGEIDQGLSLIDAALQRVESSGERFAEAEIHRVRGLLLSQRSTTRPLGESGPEDRRLAQESALHAIDIARKQGARFWELRALLLLLKLCDDDEQITQVRSALKRALSEIHSIIRIPEIVEAERFLAS